MIFEGTKNQFFFGLGLTRAGTAIPTIDNLVVLAAVMDVPMDEIIVIDVNRTKQISA